MRRPVVSRSGSAARFRGAPFGGGRRRLRLRGRDRRIALRARGVRGPWRGRRARAGGAVRNQRDDIADRRRVACGDSDIGQKAVGLGLDLHDGLVGLDLHQRVARLHRFARLLQPCDDQAGGLRHAEGRHDHLTRHRTAPPSRTGARARPRSGASAPSDLRAPAKRARERPSPRCAARARRGGRRPFR